MPHHENLIPNAFAARRREAKGKEAPSWGLNVEVDSASEKRARLAKGAGQTEEKSWFNPRGAGLKFRDGVRF